MHRRDGRLILAATDLVGFLECGHLTNLERQADAGLRHKPSQREDPEVQLLQRRGGRHEERYIEQLEADGRQVKKLAADWNRAYEERASETEDLMRRGVDVIYQATVFDGRWVGFPDFLLRVGEPGELGRDHHYEVADTKLAHAAKASALIQICSYVEQVERVQGMPPERVYVVTGGAEAISHPFRVSEMMAYYRRAKARFEEVLGRELDVNATYPDPVEHCSVCRWYGDHCWRQWRQDDSLTLVAGIRREQREVLATNNVRTRAALAALEKPIDFITKRAQAESMWKAREQARLQIQSHEQGRTRYELLEPERDADGALTPDRGLSGLPAPDVGDLFFDIEGDPFAFWEGLEYLFGIWENPTGDGLWDDGYQGIWALDREQEKQAFQQVIDLFIGRLREHPGMHIYHYGAYEPSHLKILAGRHATREEELDQLLRGRVFVDLYRLVKQGVRVGAEGYSIKNLEDLYGFRRDDMDLRTAGESIVEFELWLDQRERDGASDEALLERIRLYNRDDCVSTVKLRDWLEQRRVEAERQFEVKLPRPGPPSSEAATTKPRDPELVELETRLMDGLPPVAEHNPDQHARWLLAQLLDWHNRERKSAWWRFFELMTLSPDELEGEKEPIGGLVYEGVVGRTKRGNLLHRYRFPAQEHDVNDMSQLHDPQKPAFDGSALGTFEIDETNFTLEISRKPDWDGTHPQAVVPSNIVWSEAQEGALKRIARWVNDNSIDSPAPIYRAARGLLRRAAPTAGQAEGEELVREGESGSDAAHRLAMNLDRTTLAIQGPPGSGKTYTGARMILELVKAGRKVGITSNSHRVIGNLLTAVCDAAVEDRYPLRAMQKAKADEATPHKIIEIKRVDENDDVLEALESDEVEVVGGTPWLWARPELEGKVHTIFVDEAGQVSLANVVALSTGAQNLVLLGDPQQLDQPTQGVHPEGAGRSALAHLLDGADVIDSEKGVFLENTWRMHPEITAYTSQLFYQGELGGIEGLVGQRVVGDATDRLAGSGLRWWPVEHAGNTDASVEEAREVARIWNLLIGREWVDRKGRVCPIGGREIVIVSPFNAHRKLIHELVGPDAWVGTVDKFQGQQAPVSIYTMATSRPEDAPRGMAFLYSLNRLNVATSRAQALAIVVASPALLAAVPRSPEQLRMANGLCALVEAANQPT